MGNIQYFIVCIIQITGNMQNLYYMIVGSCNYHLVGIIQNLYCMIVQAGLSLGNTTFIFQLITIFDLW